MAQPPVGIDLGTTFSSLAVIGPAGTPEIIPNDDGERLTASAVFFQEEGPLLVGKVAVEQTGGYSDRIARWMKRDIGTPEWAFPVDGRSYSAIEISAMVLRKVKQDAEKLVGPFEQAVITVPAYFDEVRRRATIEAGKLAGLEVLRIINEPTAAAIAYASSGGEPGTVLIYDFGGGTFDASIVRIKGGLDVEVVASEGDHELGGHDLDEALARHYNARLQQAHGVSIQQESGEWYDLVKDAERDKRHLSKLDRITGKVQTSVGGHTVNVPVDRREFEDMVKDHLVRTKMLVESVLADAELSLGDIDEVLIVGGSTRIPAVRAMLKEMFGREPKQSINPDEAVAQGAAIQAAAIKVEPGTATLSPVAAQRMSSARIRDVCPRSYGTFAVEDVYGVPKNRNTVMIKKNTPLPATKCKTFYTLYDGQEAIECSINAGDETDPDFVQKIVEGEFLALPPGLPANSPIEVEYRFNLDGCMECVFTEPSSGRSQPFALGPKELGIATDEEASNDEIDFDDLVIE